MQRVVHSISRGFYLGAVYTNGDGGGDGGVIEMLECINISGKDTAVYSISSW